MATVSSHILDSVSGKSAAGIRCELFLLDGDEKRLLFDVAADQEGRISEPVELDESKRGAEFELVFHGGDYFDTRSMASDSMVSSVVIRFSMNDDDRRYHLPVMLSPHSYSTWWSS
jgi:5-hydroxyisourate hydrolase